MRHSEMRRFLLARRLLSMIATAVWAMSWCISTSHGQLQVDVGPKGDILHVRRLADGRHVVTQQARPDFRPYLHPLHAPDGPGVLTEANPQHHPHQTGIYWGFTRVNGRDYFHHPQGDYWRRVSLDVLRAQGDSVAWQTIYDLLDSHGEPVMRETQQWTLREQEGEYLLDLHWQGTATQDITIGRYDYGGLFVRMPWRPGSPAEVVNSARQRNGRAEGQRALWLDVGMQLDGRKDLAHIAIFDHPKNRAFPQYWRVDGQFGVGPVPCRQQDWPMKAGESGSLRYRLVVYTGGKVDDVKLTEKWSQFSGQSGTWAQWGIAQQEGRTAKFLTPEAAVQAMTVPDGFAVNVFAAEPTITQPMAFCWDDRGRMWIAENRDYESRGSGFANSGDSRILILEDTDHDGQVDSRKVFLEGIPFPAGIAVGFDGLWLGAPPNLLFVPDRNGDDRADMEDIEVRLTGWGIRDRHETLNSFHWGPDGWLYGCQGFATPSTVGKPQGKGRIYKRGEPFPDKIPLEGPGVEINGGVWRYHPVKDRFEVVAHGFSNPWGIDYDANGQLFITACVIPHLWHVIPGGIYHRQGGRHFNPYVYDDIKTIADHRHRSAHGGARVYLSDAFPPNYHGRIFMANIHEHAVLTDILEPRGSGFIGRHGDDFLLANNAQWIGFSMEIGPEGAVYVLDWHDADICGKDVLQKGTGRVFRINAQQSRAENWEGRYADIAQMSDRRLIALQDSTSAWHARRARLILQQRAAAGHLAQETFGQLKEAFRQANNSPVRLRTLWALHLVGGWSADELTRLLQDDDPHVRAWSVQLLCEDHAPPPAAQRQFAAMAEQDSSAVVRLYLAAALQRVPRATTWAIARGLAKRGEDAADHNIPKMIWFGIEPRVVDDASRAVQLARECQLPLLSRHIARRLVDGDQLEPLVTAMTSDSNGLPAMLQGLQDGLEGRREVQAPPSWKKAYARLVRDPQLAATATLIAQQFGDQSAAVQQLNLLRDRAAPLAARRQALQGLADRRHDGLQALLPTLLTDQDLRRDVIRAMAVFDHPPFAGLLIDEFPDLSDQEKLDALQTLAARPSYGRALTEAIRTGTIRRDEVPAYIARLLRRVVGNGFVDVWGPIDGISANTEAAFAKYRTLLAEQAMARADVAHGRQVFAKTCMPCHKMYGEGGEIGPELTGANRTNLNYLLDNILTPSAVIQDAYKMVIVTTHDGRTFAGTVAGEDDRRVTLRVAGRDMPLVIPKSEIESREVAPVSMMPDGLLATLPEQDVVDLFAFLQRLQPSDDHGHIDPNGDVAPRKP